MKLYRCDKVVLRFYPHGAQFLNGYTCNTVDHPRNAFLDLKGNIVAVFDQFRRSEEEVWVVVEKRFVGRVREHLKKYLALTDTVLEVMDPKNVYQCLETKEILIAKEVLTADASEEEYTLFRVKNALPLQGVDFDQELVLNVEEGLVSYTKGCYLGQEIVARVHYRSKPPKKLTVKRERDCTAEEFSRMTSKVFDPVSGQLVGFVIVAEA